MYAILVSMKNTIPSPKGILFDMDGVLLLPTQSSDQSWHQVCQQFAPILDILPQHLEEALTESRRIYRMDIEQDTQKQRRDRLEPFETRCETVERGLERIGRGDETLAGEMVSAYETLSDEHRQPAPYALETLQKLRSCALPLILISNGNAMYQRKKIKNYHLASFFDAIFIEEEFGVAKPDPRIFLAALNHLHMAAQETWMIGDDLAFDIAASQRLGIFAIWCDPARSGLPEGTAIHPDQIIHELPEIFDLLSDASILA
jgi:putative hydrolase of the HAD superfamily